MKLKVATKIQLLVSRIKYLEDRRSSLKHLLLGYIDEIKITHTERHSTTTIHLREADGVSIKKFLYSARDEMDAEIKKLYKELDEL